VAAADPAALGGPCRVLIILVLNEAQTDEVLFGPKGAAAALAPGSLVIASATVSPNFARSLGQRWRRGEFLCSMRRFRGSGQAREGKITMMTSGPAEAYAAGEAVLAAISAQVYRLGPEHGAGTKVKVLNQLLAGFTSRPWPRRWPWGCARG